MSSRKRKRNVYVEEPATTSSEDDPEENEEKEDEEEKEYVETNHDRECAQLRDPEASKPNRGSGLVPSTNDESRTAFNINVILRRTARFSTGDKYIDEFKKFVNNAMDSLVGCLYKASVRLLTTKIDNATKNILPDVLLVLITSYASVTNQSNLCVDYSDEAYTNDEANPILITIEEAPRIMCALVLQPGISDLVPKEMQNWSYNTSYVKYPTKTRTGRDIEKICDANEVLRGSKAITPLFGWSMSGLLLDGYERAGLVIELGVNFTQSDLSFSA